ncbi:MAG: hypothetical protein MR673_07445 [Fusobacterium perfoetens]|uniref:hypothetical protein n=1 Tax=Fusobacterium perfoetens TaxID=852 RepID=UPI0023F20DE2|nr:hypothetical protein [Fusobacterium perfoetens]MCI6152946.1 hypothetical protein [Fusobacterium perfoetens]MDY3237358.1 hypothetical protein [Fusobacterium perfoetens]
MEKKIDERLKNLLNSRRTKQDDNLKTNTSNSKEKTDFQIIKSINGDFNLTDDNELNDFLKEKSLEVLNLQAHTSLELGKIFTEVESKLSGNRYTGCYVKWLETNGYNKMTALRHRNRYKLYSLCSTDFSKESIAKLSYKKIDEILKSENPQEIISKLEKTNNIDILNESLIIDLKTPIEFEDNDNFYLDNFLNHLPKKETLENLPSKKKKTLITLLKKIDKILNDVQ